MKGELDWIVMKALEKDRTRRYETATALVKDVLRYINGDAVEACPPTLGYRLRKAYRRNRAAVLVATAFVGLIAGAAVVGALLAVQARRAEALAEAKRIEAEEQTRKAELYSADLSKLSAVYTDAAVKAEIRNAGSRLDADLLEYKSDARVGLLRLARPLKHFVGPIEIESHSGTRTWWEYFDQEAEFVKLREFQAAAVIAAGQEFVPLVPPIDSGNYFDEVSPDGRYYILASEQSGLKLLALPSLAERGVLREAGERLVRWGFSPDSQTAWTQDADSVVRFWNTDATLRAKTPLRPERFVYPAGLTADNLRTAVRSSPPNAVLVADGVAVLQTEYPEWEWEADHTGQPTWMKPKKGTTARKGPTDLYSTRTGQFVRRLDQPGRRLAFGSDWKLSPDNRWLVAIEEPYDDQGRWPPGGAAQVVILSTEDGRELARLDQPWPTSFLYVQVSPTGKWVITYPHGVGANRQPPTTDHVRLWNSATWQPAKDTAFHDAMMRQKYKTLPSFVTDDVFSLVISDGGEGTAVGVFHIDRPGSWLRYDDLGYSGPGWEAAVGELGGTLIRCGRVITDPNTFQRLKPPVGRKYAAELAKLAPDGRFWEGLDTVTEKDLPYHEFGGKYFPGFGHVGIRRYHD
jgi:hypothetical protein